MGTTVGPREFTFAALGDTGPSETPVSTCGHALSHMSRQEAHECLTATLDPKNTCSPGKKGPARGPRRAGVVGVSASIQSPRPPVIIAELSTSQDTTERPGHRMHSLALITTTVQRKELTPQSWTDTLKANATLCLGTACTPATPHPPGPRPQHPGNDAAQVSWTQGDTLQHESDDKHLSEQPRRASDSASGQCQAST